MSDQTIQFGRPTDIDETVELTHLLGSGAQAEPGWNDQTMILARVPRESEREWDGRPQHVLLLGVVGSQAYGFAGANSDIDRLGVFASPTEDLLGLDPPAETAENPHRDEVLWELSKYLRLAMKSNPTVLELLYLPDYEIRTHLGEQLVELRDCFLSESYVREAHLGFARSQIAKLRRQDDTTAKAARHLARVVHQGFELFSDGTLTVRRDNPIWYLRFGERVASGDVAAAEGLLAEYEERFADTRSVLPDQPNRGAVDAWLRKARRELLV